MSIESDPVQIRIVIRIRMSAVSTKVLWIHCLLSISHFATFRRNWQATV